MLNVEQHPDKTFIGRVERGFDFLGYYLKPGLLGVSVVAINNCVARISRLYEQGADYVRIGEYMRRWLRWVQLGLEIYGHEMKAKEGIKKHLHSSGFEECRCLATARKYCGIYAIRLLAVNWRHLLVKSLVIFMKIDAYRSYYPFCKEKVKLARVSHISCLK